MTSRPGRATLRTNGGGRRRRSTGVALGGLLGVAGLMIASPGVTACAAARSTPAGVLPATGAATHAATPAAGGLTITEQWSVELPAEVAQSSPILDTIDGTRAAVVGALNGKVYALGLAHGGEIKGWPASDPGAVPIQSTPSVSGGVVFVGTGDAGHPSPGGYLAINPDGRQRWYHTVPVTPGSAASSGVQAGLTVGTLQGTRVVVSGTLGQYEEELRANSGAVMPGFPWFAADTEFSTPSIVNLYGSGHNYIVEGGESTAGVAYGVPYNSGGHIRILGARGNRGLNPPSGGLVCQYNSTQGIYSSPAVGNFLNHRANGIVAGTSTDYATASDTDKVIAVDSHCNLRWKASLDGSTQDSPALVDARGNNHLQVAEGTSTGQNSGTVYLLSGISGHIYWAHNVAGQVIGGITSADLGRGYQDLLVPTTNGLYILDGKSGRALALLGQYVAALQSSPLVSRDADGRIGITVAGYNAQGGRVIHWEVAGTDGRLAGEAGAWPMFHHDPQLSGSTLTPARH